MKNLVLVIFFLISAAAHPQESPAEQKAWALTAKMQKQIGFNDATKAKVHQVNVDFATRLLALQDSGSGKMEKLQELKTLDDDRAQVLKKIFTQAEYALFEKFRQENRQEMKQRYKDRKG